MAQAINIDDFQVDDKVIVSILGKDLYRYFFQIETNIFGKILYKNFPISDWVNPNSNDIKTTNEKKYQLYATIVSIDKNGKTIEVLPRFPYKPPFPSEDLQSESFDVNAADVKWWWTGSEDERRRQNATTKQEKNEYDNMLKIAQEQFQRAKRKKEAKERREQKKKERKKERAKFTAHPRKSGRVRTKKLHEEYTEKLKL
jgi:hypothetical protein